MFRETIRQSNSRVEFLYMISPTEKTASETPIAPSGRPGTDRRRKREANGP